MKTIIGVISLFLVSFIILAENKNAAYYLREAKDRITQNRSLEAIELLKKSIGKNPNYVPALIEYGSLLRKNQAYAQALFFLKKANKLSPKNEKSIFELAENHLALNNFSMARATIRKGLQIKPYDSDFNYLMAKIYLKQRRSHLAKKKLRKIIRSNPGHFLSYLTLGKVYLIERRYHRAEAAFQKARLIEPENPNLFVQLADIHLQKIIYEKEDTLYSKELDPAIFQKPIDLLMNAKAFDSELISANLKLAKIYALMKNQSCQEALSYLNSVLRVNPSHYAARYYLGFCLPEKIPIVYQKLLTENANDEIARYALQRYLMQKYPTRQHPKLMRLVREHYNMGTNLAASFKQNQAYYEYRWSQHLFPGFIKAHTKMLKFYQRQGDFKNLQAEINFLRQTTKKQKYQDMYEQFIRVRRKKLYYQEGISNPKRYRSPTPLFIFYFKPENPLTNYPDAGRAIADKLAFALKPRGRLTVFTDSVRNKMFSKLLAQPYFGFGGYYTGKASALVQKNLPIYLRSDISMQSQSDLNALNKNDLRYALDGSFQNRGNGIVLKANLIDLSTGLSIKTFRVRANGRGYLREAAINLAQKIYSVIPFKGKIIKKSRNGILVNLGRRDGLTLKTKLIVKRNNQILTNLKIKRIDSDLLWGETTPKTAIYKVQSGDQITLN